mgnify:CR=1 FL=1
MQKLNAYQDLFVKQELIYGTSENNRLHGRAKLKGVRYSEFCDCINYILENSKWPFLQIDTTKNKWLLKTKKQGDLICSSKKLEHPSLSTKDKLWTIFINNYDHHIELNVFFHHALADAHSFQLFWKQIKSYLRERNFIDWETYTATPKYLEEIPICNIKLVPDIGLGPVKRHTTTIDIKRKDKYEKISRSIGLNLATILLGTLQKLLNIAEENLGINLQTGIALRNRPSKIAKETFTTQVNFLPVRHHRIEDLKLLERSVKELFRFQSYPLTKWLKNNNRTSAFNVLFSYQKEAYTSNNDFSDAQIIFEPVQSDETILGVHILEYSQNEIKISFDYRTDVADECFWRSFICNYFLSIRSLIEKKHHNIHFNLAKVKSNQNNYIPLWEGFNKAPDNRIAIATGSNKLTFGQLKYEIDQIRDPFNLDILSLKPDRSIDSIKLILSAWKNKKTVTFSNIDKSISVPKSTLYIGETSGSTGNSKKIAIQKEGIESLLFDWNKLFELEKNSIHLSIADQKFDVFFGDLFRSILSGNTLVLANENERFSADSILKLINEHNVTHLESTPTFLDLLYDRMKKASSLKFIICGSEPISPKLYNRLIQLEESKKIFNSYGLTEVSIDSSIARLNKYNKIYFPLGFPVGNQEFSIVNNKGVIVPFGVWGELRINGNCVGIPLNSVSPKYSKINNKLSFLTGDKALLHPQLGLIVKGRITNDFLKINGRRIPAIDIENYLNEKIQNAKFVVFEHQELCILGHDSNYEDTYLMNLIKSRFSRHQYPNLLIKINKWPINSNGKTDIKKLIKNLNKTYKKSNPWHPNGKLVEQIVFSSLKKIKKPFGDSNESLYKYGWNSIDLISFTNEISLKGFHLDIIYLFESPKISTILKKIKKTEFIKNKSQNEINLDNDNLTDILDILNR